MSHDPRDGQLLLRIFVAFAIFMVSVFFIVQFFARAWPGREFTGDPIAIGCGVVGATLSLLGVWLVHRAFSQYRKSHSN